MKSIVDVLEQHWEENPDMKDLKHCVYQGEKLKEVEDSYFVNKKLKLAENEEIYLIVHGRLYMGLPGWKSGGFSLTNFGLHFDTHKDGFFSPIILMPQGPKGFISYEDLKSIEIGEHDRCAGTEYYGHNLVVNGEKLGLVRISRHITFDEKVINYCNQLFSKLVGVCLDSTPDLIKHQYIS